MKALVLVSCLVASVTAAQTSPPAPDKPVPAAFEFSGIFFANFQYSGGEKGRSANRFDVERAYLNFQTPVRDRLAVRVTTDLFQQAAPGSDSFYRGWIIRAKYAYLNYTYVDNSNWRASARAGLLQTVFIEHDEKTWSRWLSTSPTERAGYFSSADAGVSTTVSFPARLGEVYATVTNGPGYTSREIDRFKDFAARITITPWARDTVGNLRGVALTAWGYRGQTASRFVDGGQGQTGSVGSGLQRDRFGFHVASSTPALSVAAQYARRIEEGETGANSPLSPRQIVDSTGTMLSAYATVRPFLLLRGSALPLSVLARLDRVTSNRDTRSRHDVAIVGLLYALSKTVSVALDYQETTPVSQSNIVPVKTYFAHLVARY